MGWHWQVWQQGMTLTSMAGGYHPNNGIQMCALLLKMIHETSSAFWGSVLHVHVWFCEKDSIFFIIGIKFVPLLRGNVQTSKGLAVLIEQLRIHGLTAEE